MMLGRRGWSGKIVIIMIMSEADDDDDDDDDHHHFHIWPRWERGKREGRKKVSLLFLVFSIIQSVLGLYSMTKTIPLNDFPSSHHTIWYYTHITRDASPAPWPKSSAPCIPGYLCVSFKMKRSVSETVATGNDPIIIGSSSIISDGVHLRAATVLVMIIFIMIN